MRALSSLGLWEGRVGLRHGEHGWKETELVLFRVKPEQKGAQHSQCRRTGGWGVWDRAHSKAGEGRSSAAAQSCTGSVCSCFLSFSCFWVVDFLFVCFFAVSELSTAQEIEKEPYGQSIMLKAGLLE